MNKDNEIERDLPEGEIYHYPKWFLNHCRMTEEKLAQISELVGRDLCQRGMRDLNNVPPLTTEEKIKSLEPGKIYQTCEPYIRNGKVEFMHCPVLVLGPIDKKGDIMVIYGKTNKNKDNSEDKYVTTVYKREEDSKLLENTFFDAAKITHINCNQILLPAQGSIIEHTMDMFETIKLDAKKSLLEITTQKEELKDLQLIQDEKKRLLKRAQILEKAEQTAENRKYIKNPKGIFQTYQPKKYKPERFGYFPFRYHKNMSDEYKKELGKRINMDLMKYDTHINNVPKIENLKDIWEIGSIYRVRQTYYDTEKKAYDTKERPCIVVGQSVSKGEIPIIWFSTQLNQIQKCRKPYIHQFNEGEKEWIAAGFDRNNFIDSGKLTSVHMNFFQVERMGSLKDFPVFQNILAESRFSTMAILDKTVPTSLQLIKDEEKLITKRLTMLNDAEQKIHDEKARIEKEKKEEEIRIKKEQEEQKRKEEERKKEEATKKHLKRISFYNNKNKNQKDKKKKDTCNTANQGR